METEQNSRGWVYEQVGKLLVRKVTVRAPKPGRPIRVVQITDLHYKACTERDLENPVLRSTNEKRWAFDPKITVPNTRRALDYADAIGADQIVVTGDAIDYLSEGSLDLLRQEIWDRYRRPDGTVDRVMVALGNHEPLRQMQGEIPDPTPFESRFPILQAAWEHPLYYFSKVLEGRVMLIQMDNGSRCDRPDAGFDPSVVGPFRADLERAEREDLAVLLFYHIPVSTGDPSDVSVPATVVGDKNGAVGDLYHQTVNPASIGTNREVYDLITSHAGRIAGCFCGHQHNDYYSEILARTPDGRPMPIPQYVLIGTPYQKGHLLEITVE